MPTGELRTPPYVTQQTTTKGLWAIPTQVERMSSALGSSCGRPWESCSIPPLWGIRDSVDIAFALTMP
jgi:hypothetical protein